MATVRPGVHSLDRARGIRIQEAGRAPSRCPVLQRDHLEPLERPTTEEDSATVSAPAPTDTGAATTVAPSQVGEPAVEQAEPAQAASTWW